MQDILLIGGLIGIMGIAILEKLFEMHGLKNIAYVLKAAFPVGAVVILIAIMGVVI